MLIWNGEPVPGTDHIISFRDDPRRIPDFSKVPKRKFRGGVRREKIDTIGVHDFRDMPAVDSVSGTHGLVHYNPRVHALRAVEVLRGHASTSRKAAYHFYPDHDGIIYQAADPATWWCYHGAKNSRSVGIGICQGSRKTPRGKPDALITIEAVDAAAELVELLFDRNLVVAPSDFAPPSRAITFCGWKPPKPPATKAPSQAIPVATVLELWAKHGRLVLGHGHCGAKVHDPGEAVWTRFGSRPGWQQVWPNGVVVPQVAMTASQIRGALARGGFADTKAFQRAHPPLEVDGIPGPLTQRAIRDAGLFP